MKYGLTTLFTLVVGNANLGITCMNSEILTILLKLIASPFTI